MNRKGFILSTYVYMLLVFFLLLLTTMLAVMNNTKLLSNKLKEQSGNTSGLIDKDYSFILLGEADMVLRKGEEYIEPGFKIQTSKKKDLSDIVSITGNVDVNNPNTYKLTYSATYNGITKKLTRNVHILDNIASSYITGLYNYRKDENGLIKDNTADENIRYAGSNEIVKNYVEFGNEGELWRIIGVFNVASDGGESTLERIKLVKDTALANKQYWDTNGINQWGETTMTSDNTTVYAGSSLMQYLNVGDSSYYNSLNSNAKSQIDEVIWNTGGLLVNDAIDSKMAYLEERGTSVGTNTAINYTTTWLGKIGLIYPSDFGYAGIGCINMRESCNTNNWLYKNEKYWTITSRASSSYGIWVLNKSVYLSSVHAIEEGEDALFVRPAVYLKYNVKVIDGDGTQDNPYKLSI